MSEDQEALTPGQIKKVVAKLRSKNPHSYHVPGVGDLPGKFVTIKHAELPAGSMPTAQQWETAAGIIAKLSSK